MLLNKGVSILDFIKVIRFDLIVLAMYATLIGIADRFSFFGNISVPVAVTLSLGTSLALLLAFRTGQSYDRWWEARQVWGAIVNDSRTLIRQLQSFTIGADGDVLVKQAVERQVIWCYVMGDYLRRKSYANRIETYFESNHIDKEQAPNMLLSLHSNAIKMATAKGLINTYQQVQLDATIMRLCDSMGKCERIKNTVFPSSYSLLIHFIIYVFATMLPFGIPDDNPIVEIALTFIIPVIFIAIEKTSILMQDPFENRPVDTPMSTIAQGIEASLRKMIGESFTPVSPKEATYYIM